LINIKDIPVEQQCLSIEGIISQGASSFRKFIVAPILFEVLPQLKTAPFNEPRFAQMRQRRKADLVSNGTIKVPSFLSFTF